MRPKQPVRVAICHESLRRELAHGLEHPIAWTEIRVPSAKQAFVEQGLKCVRVGAAQVRGRLVGAASREHAEAAELVPLPSVSRS
jgi:hypothetical protein